jgi:hypothetical protein
MMFGVIDWEDWEDDEGTGWLLVAVMVGTRTAEVLAMLRRGARVGRVGREELGIGKTVLVTAFEEA